MNIGAGFPTDVKEKMTEEGEKKSGKRNVRARGTEKVRKSQEKVGCVCVSNLFLCVM